MSERILFMGSPNFSVPALKMLHQNFNLAGVVTQPDRIAGRGKKIRMSAVKEAALNFGIPIYQPERLRTEDDIKPIRELNPDIIIVAAFGQILRENILTMPEFGCVNVHASLLPRWRGASPINACIVNGDAQTGITIMQMDKGIDTGEMFSQSAISIDQAETAGSLFEKLSILGADLLKDTLPKIFSGEIIPQPQDESLATYAPMMKKADGLLDFNEIAQVLERKVRGYSPWPGTYMEFEGTNLKIHQAKVSTQNTSMPDKRLTIEQYPAVETPESALVLITVQPPGKKPMDGKDFVRGARNWSVE